MALLVVKYYEGVTLLYVLLRPLLNRCYASSVQGSVTIVTPTAIVDLANGEVGWG